MRSLRGLAVTRATSARFEKCVLRYFCSHHQKSQVTGADKLVESLVSCGVRTVFGIPGTHTKHVYRALDTYSSQISHVTMRHEQGAGFAAEGHARATGELAVALVVTGVGLTNTITPMAVALADSVPLLVISSDVPHFWQKRPSRQYSHFVPGVAQIAGAVTKQSFHVTCSDEVEDTMRKAIFLARSGRPGPVHVSVPIDVLAATATRQKSQAHISEDETLSPGPLTPSTKELLTAVAKMLARSERPLIVAGGGALHASAPLKSLAEALNAPVLATVAGKGVLDERHGLAVGGRLHTSARQYLLERADALLLVGTQLSPTDFWQFKHSEEVPLQLARLGPTTAHVDSDCEVLAQGGIANSGGAIILADSALACTHLLQCFKNCDAYSPRWGGRPWNVVAVAKKLADSPRGMSLAMGWSFLPGSGGEFMCGVLSSLRRTLPEQSPVAVDVCRLGYTALSLYPSYYPKSFLYPVGTTCLGYAVPAAIGAAIARPNVPVCVIAGDGGLQFTLQELAIAAVLNLPILFIVWNDSAYGEIRATVAAKFASVQKPDLTHLSAAYGITHIHTTDLEGFTQSLGSVQVKELLLGKSGPVIVEVEHDWVPQAKDVGEVAALPRPVLGTMTFGWKHASSPVDDQAAAQIVSCFVQQGGVEVDTARMYANGETERMLGRIIANMSEECRHVVKVATKANPAGIAGDSSTGGFRTPQFAQQVDDSLQALVAESVDLFYLHWPDPDVLLEDVLHQTQLLYKEGKFARLGISNYAASEVEQIHSYMKARGWVLPSVYQGMYNAVTRSVEDELFPILRRLNMSFYAYNPLAGGLLTGKHFFDQGPISKGRFKENEFYQERYWNLENFKALQAVQEACVTEDLPMADAAIQWLVHHSMLDGTCGDAVILGCSSVKQLEHNLRSCKDEMPLPPGIVTAWEKAWEQCKWTCPRYDGYGLSGERLV